MKLRERSRIQLVTTRSIFIISLIVVTLTTLAIWLFGLGQHRTLFINSLLSTSVLSIAFFLFLTVALYRGIKLKDNLGRITDQINLSKVRDLSLGVEIPSSFPEMGEGIVGILFWILFSILLVVFIWVFSALVWAMALAFAAMLYWIFFRALRLVFKNSNKCKGDLGACFVYGLSYTLLYNFWIYSIVFVSHYL